MKKPQGKKSVSGNVQAPAKVKTPSGVGEISRSNPNPAVTSEPPNPVESTVTKVEDMKD